MKKTVSRDERAWLLSYQERRERTVSEWNSLAGGIPRVFKFQYLSSPYSFWVKEWGDIPVFYSLTFWPG
jgi:hypothetical protein